MLEESEDVVVVIASIAFGDVAVDSVMKYLTTNSSSMSLDLSLVLDSECVTNRYSAEK